MLLRDILGLLNLGQFDPINQMIQLTVTPLSRAHCIFKLPKTVSNATVQNLLQEEVTTAHNGKRSLDRISLDRNCHFSLDQKF